MTDTELKEIEARAEAATPGKEYNRLSNLKKHCAPIDLIGQRFGKLVVIKREDNSRYGKTRWLCQCDCGNTSIVEGVNMRNGHSKSCSSRCQQIKHGHGGRHDRTSEYMIWSQMKDRCHNQKNKNFSYYGGRGISVCQEWMRSFEKFLSDMGPRPGKGYSIDRIDVDGNYDPQNCRWATHKVQMSNTRHRKREAALPMEEANES